MKSIAFIPALLFLLATGALGSQWIQIPGGLKHVTASVNYLWGVSSNGNIYKCARPCTGGWIQVPGRFKQVDADDMEVWGVDSADQIYKRPVDGSGRWLPVPGRLKQVSASGNGYIWGVTSKDDIYKCKKPCNGAWIRVAGKLKQIDGGYGYVYAVDSNDKIYRSEIDGSGGWHHIPGKLTHITASGRDEVFGVNKAGVIYRCRKPCVGHWERLSGTGALKQVDVTVDAWVGVTGNYRIFKQPLP